MKIWNQMKEHIRKKNGPVVLRSVMSYIRQPNLVMAFFNKKLRSDISKENGK